MGAGPHASIQAPFAVGQTVGDLITSASIVDEAGVRWENGFEFEPERCNSGTGITDPCASTSKTVGANQDVVVVEPFTIYATDSCTTLDRDRDLKGRARRALLATQSRQIASEFWRGTLATSAGWDEQLYLANELTGNYDLLNNGTDMPYRAALTHLQQGLKDCGYGGRGMIHALPLTVALWGEARMVQREGNVITDLFGNVVVADAGYDGSRPNGTTDATRDTAYAFATGQVYIRLSEPMAVPENEAEAVNRSTNLVTQRYERLAAVYWDGCCHLAANVDHCDETACFPVGS